MSEPRPVPRYTSYPTAPHFHAGVDATTYARWLAELPEKGTLSLYLHVPFCDRLCWFCGCHTKQVARYAPVAAYVESLTREIRAVGKLVPGRPVTAIHLGGGSPSLLSPADFDRLNGALRAAFDIRPEVEFSIEIDPNDMDEARYDALARIGITRVSLGVQDFNPKVQAAINRIQTYEQTRAVVEAMRARGIGSVNLDVLYGLPFQTVASVEATVAEALSLAPDRFAIFGYAHVPWLKTHQRLIDEAALPGLEARFAQSQAAAAAITAAGYEPIGFDHFAKPEDRLAIAARTGHLHRNFQGFTADDADALVGLGASAISCLPQGYAQNLVPTHLYERQAEDIGFATARGIALTGEDRARRWVIERLLCDAAVDCAEMYRRFPASADRIWLEMETAALYDADGHVRFDGQTFVVTLEGRPFVRSIAAVFDAYLPTDTARYSKAV
jgi:oxygen-independent coproporphyrinogen-3 oxidase